MRMRMRIAAIGGVQYTTDGINFQRMTTDQAIKLYEFASQLAADEEAADTDRFLRALKGYGDDDDGDD